MCVGMLTHAQALKCNQAPLLVSDIAVLYRLRSSKDRSNLGPVIYCYSSIHQSFKLHQNMGLTFPV